MLCRLVFIDNALFFLFSGTCAFHNIRGPVECFHWCPRLLIAIPVAIPYETLFEFHANLLPELF